MSSEVCGGRGGRGGVRYFKFGGVRRGLRGEGKRNLIRRREAAAGGDGWGGGDLGGVGEVDRTDKRQTQKWTDTLVGQCLQGGPGLGLRFECSPMKNCSNEEDETGQGAAAAAASNCLEPAMGIVSCW